MLYIMVTQFLLNVRHILKPVRVVKDAVLLVFLFVTHIYYIIIIYVLKKVQFLKLDQDPLDSSNHVIFKAGETITKYYGETINLAELNNRYHHKTAPYAIEIIRHKLYEDGALSRGVGATANRKIGSANATLSINTRGKYASLKATKNIYNNQEIFLSYGTAFKMNENNVSHSTNNIRNKKQKY